ncbi:Trimethyltridecatetraene synthase-like protein [Drosera capensis]
MDPQLEQTPVSTVTKPPLITMEPPWIMYMAAWLAPLALLLALCLRHRKAPNSPPGPRSWPVIGNLYLIGSLPHRSLHQLSRKYGHMMMLRWGVYPVVVASSVETAQLILKTHDISFASRPKTAAGKYTTYNYSDITWSPYGPYWRQARRMCLMELFSQKRLDFFEYIRVEEMNSFLRALHGSARKPILLKDYLSNVSLNVISRMVLGKRYSDEEEGSIVGPDEFKRLLDELFLLNGVLNIGDWIPYVGFLDLQGYVKRMKTLAKRFDGFMEHVLNEHNKRREEEKGVWVAKDMVDMLLELADDPNNEVKLERHGVKAFTQDLIAGGTESSAVTVEWAMSELLCNPEIFKKATEELDRVVGRERWVQEKDIASLPYIRSIVKETMRLHPVAPMLVPRIAREDINIAGYDIVKDTRVLVNTWTIQRDPAVYENPEEFYPERFMGNNNIDVLGRNFELLPFGSGRRMCPGYSLGLKVIESSLANVLHGFSWKLPDGMNPTDLDMEEIFGLSNPRKTPLIVVPEPRLPQELYRM